jgi:hypothetical protein
LFNPIDIASYGSFFVNSTEDLREGKLVPGEASKDSSGLELTVFYIVSLEVIFKGWFEPFIYCSF